MQTRCPVLCGWVKENQPFNGRAEKQDQLCWDHAYKEGATDKHFAEWKFVIENGPGN